MKHSFRRRLNFFFGCIGFTVVCLATWYGIFWQIGQQKNMVSGDALAIADTLQTAPETAATLRPVTFTKLEEPKAISTGKRPVTYSTKAKQPTAAEKEAAERAAWIAKRDSIAAVENWRKKVAAAKPVEQPVKKVTAKKQQSQKRRTNSQPANTKNQFPQFVVAKVKPPTVKEIEEQKLWILMKRETDAVMGGRKDPTITKPKPVQNLKVLELTADKWTDFK